MKKKLSKNWIKNLLYYFGKNEQKDKCSHQLISKIIFNTVFCAFILGAALTINFFHLPLHIYGLEVEKFELGLIIIFLLVGKNKFKFLLFAAIILPFMDQVLHGHNFITVPFEVIYNLFALGLFYALNVRLRQDDPTWKRWGIFFSCLICFIILRIIYLGAILSIFAPTLNFFSWQSFINLRTQLMFWTFLIVTTLKFSIILSIAMKYRGKFAKILSFQDQEKY